MTRLILASLAAVVLCAASPDPGVTVTTNAIPGTQPPLGKPVGPDLPSEIHCYRHNETPFVMTDKDGAVLFEIRCP